MSKNNKIEYSRLTFILSALGFIGSIGFYLGVLREVYSPALDKQKIERLKVENGQLKKSIYNLTQELKDEK